MDLDYNKLDGLVPVIIQDELTFQVLMLGFMNEEAYKKTQEEKIVTFFSRSKNRLWTKGETSGNFLHVKEIFGDCDDDSILIKVQPQGATCHRGTISCFDNNSPKGFLYKLQNIIKTKIETKDESSYTYKLTQRGINKVAQKVGEEAVEIVIEAKDSNDELFLGEAADLMYHYLILLHEKGFTMEDVEKTLIGRNK